MATDFAIWSTLSGSAAIVLAPWIAGRWAAPASKHHDSIAAEESAQARLVLAEENFRNTLLTTNAALVGQINAEQAEKREVERDRDRGWWLARWWERTAHRITHSYRNALAAANLQLEKAGLPAVKVIEIDLPGLEDPKPEKPGP